MKFIWIVFAVIVAVTLTAAVIIITLPTPPPPTINVTNVTATVQCTAPNPPQVLFNAVLTNPNQYAMKATLLFKIVNVTTFTTWEITYTIPAKGSLAITPTFTMSACLTAATGSITVLRVVVA